MEQNISDFSEIRETNKLLKRKLASILRSWHCGISLVSYTRNGGFVPPFDEQHFFLTEFTEFSENI